MAKVLIVEDSYDTTEAMARYLRKAGHTVALATNGKEALIEVIANMPDVVLLDLYMPEMDGPSFLEIIRSYLRFYSLPIVVLTGAPVGPMIDRIVRLKVNSILVKGEAGLHDIRLAIEQAASVLQA